MSRLASRRLRLLRLRTIECRIAATNYAEADARHAAVAAVADRLAKLRLTTSSTEGLRCGRDLQSLAELVQRLDDAQAGLGRSLDAASATRSDCQDRQIAAHVIRERTDRVHTNATRCEHAERELRAAAAMPPRLRKTGA